MLDIATFTFSELSCLKKQIDKRHEELKNQLEENSKVDEFKLLELHPLLHGNLIREIIKVVVELGLKRNAIFKDNRKFCDSSNDGGSCWYIEKVSYNTGGETCDCAYHIATYLLKYGDIAHYIDGVLVPDKSKSIYTEAIQR